MLAHNGEINTLRGNVNRMQAREADARQPTVRRRPREAAADHRRAAAATRPSFDNALELLVLAGRSLPHAVMMLVPEAVAGQIPHERRQAAFYEYHAGLMEPWDGPAALVFTDGTLIGAMLDRNGLRPAATWVTKRRHGRHGLRGRRARHRARAASRRRAGCSPARCSWSTRPGPHRRRQRNQGQVARASARTAAGSNEQPASSCDDLLSAVAGAAPTDPDSRCSRCSSAFGYTLRGAADVIAPDGHATARRPVGSMGNDTPLAVLSRPAAAALQLLQAALRPGDQPADRPDPRGDRHVADDASSAREGNLLDETPEHVPAAEAASPDPDQRGPGADCARLERSRTCKQRHALDRSSRRRDGRGRPAPGAGRAVPRGRAGRSPTGATILILSDRGVDAEHAADPRPAGHGRRAPSPDPRRARTRCGLVIETGEPREVHHFALLIGYGARRGQSVPGLRHAATACSPTAACPTDIDAREAGDELHQGRRARAC